MRGYLLPMVCARCGGELDHVTSSKVDAGSSCCAVAKCSQCSTEWTVHVQLRALRPVGRWNQAVVA